MNFVLELAGFGGFFFSFCFFLSMKIQIGKCLLKS